MIRTSQGRGYTIMETMIVLAISALMFLSAVAAFGGRQQDVQFNQAVRDLESKVQDIINDVSTGYFDNPGTLTCEENSGALTLSSAASDQGSSDDCIFVGKAIHFDISNTSSHKLNIQTVVGLRNNPISGGSVSNLDEANPVILDNTVLGYNTDYPLAWGLRISSVETDITSGPVSGIAFMASFAKQINTRSVSNSQNVRYGNIPGDLTDDLSVFTAKNIDESTVTGPEPIVICLQSRDNDRKKAALIIGDDGTTQTKLEFDTTRAQAC